MALMSAAVSVAAGTGLPPLIKYQLLKGAGGKTTTVKPGAKGPVSKTVGA